MARVAQAPHVFWGEYQALTDVMNFYKSDPVAVLGLPGRGPLVRVVRISRMLQPRNLPAVPPQLLPGALPVRAPTTCGRRTTTS